MQFIVRVNEDDELPNHEGMKKAQISSAALYRTSPLGQAQIALGYNGDNLSDLNAAPHIEQCEAEKYPA